MDRRAFITGIAASGLSIPALLAACGSKAGVPASTLPPGSVPASSVPTSTVPGIEHPTGATEFVVRVHYSGGLVANNYQYMRYPTVLLTGDGRMITPGAVPAVYPGPLLPALRERTITEAGVQQVLQAAQQAQLLGAIPKYDVNPYVMDAADTVVEIHAMGKVFVHVAYALDMPPPSDIPDSDARIRLRQFVQQVTDPSALVGAANLGPDGQLQPTAYRLQANRVNLSDYGNEPKPTVTPWPADTGVVLAQAGECVEVSAAKVGALLAAANQLSFFTEGTATYSVLAVPVLPGDITCPSPGAGASTTSVAGTVGG